MASHNNGMMGLAHLKWQLNDYHQTLVHFLRQAGFLTVIAGEQHIASDVTRIGYERIISGSYSGEHRAAEFLRSRPQEPFFLDIGFNETHRVYPEPGPLDNPQYVRPPAAMPDTPQARADMAGFITSARALDRKMGIVLDALQESGLAENTLVMCTTDHGLAFPAMKCNLTAHGTGVMLILRGPGGFTGGKVVDALVSHVDLFPSLCDLLHLEPPAWLQGRSLLPLARGEVTAVREAVFSEVNFHVSIEPQRSARTLRWNYIRRFDSRDRPVLPNCDDSISKTLWLEHGWRERPVAVEQLYDLIFDPNETCNLAAEPGCAAALAEMRAVLAEWMSATRDPLLIGPLEWPDDHPHVSPDGISPSELNR
jgi:arylsulfatase A-like enzyme